ncbi:MAG TPA: thioesterase family protein [Burkholderiaceae bacterium]|nr:thioesterase family protein [Burkholderiaceae bacterium]
MNREPSNAYHRIADDTFVASELTRGPWSPDHQHAGPPTALVCRAIERAAAAQGLTHLARLTANLLRPVPLGELSVAVDEDYAGRNAAHFSARLSGGGKELARFTALMQREVETPTPPGTPGHPLPAAPRRPGDCEPFAMPFAGRQITYADFVETRTAEGRPWAGPCSVWFRMRHPLVAGESPSPYQRVAVAADSGNGISAVLDFSRYSFVNCDLTINLLRRPVGDWICLAARTQLGGNGCGLAESALYDEAGLIGRATQSLAVRLRSSPA